MRYPWMVRLAALASSLVVGSSLMMTAPASAAPSPDPDTATASADSPPISNELREAVERDLGLTWEQYVERGRQAEQAADLDRQLHDNPGYAGVALEGDEVVVSGSGAAVTRAARSDGVRAEATNQALDADQVAGWYADQVDADGTGLLGIGWSGDGWLVTVATPDAPGRLADGTPGMTPNGFAAAHPGIKIKVGELPTTQAEILGGQGWGWGTRMPRCSIGFAAFAPDGRQAMITAGHCNDNGALPEARWENDLNVSLGSLAFAQFGSPDNTSNTAATAGADIGAYAGSSPDLRAAMDGYRGLMTVTGTTAPVAGAPVCTSGRTTKRWQCSTIEAVGPYAIQGPNGANDIRWAQGFSVPMLTRPGDSGAGMMTGLKAIGIVSAGGTYDGKEITFGSNLNQALSRGYTLETWVNIPRAEPESAGRLRGTVSFSDSVPAGTVVRIESAAGVRTVPVGADGRFDTQSPGRARLQVVSGRSSSDAVDYDPRYGSSLDGRFCGLRNGGCFQRFTSGSVYWSPTTGEHRVGGRIYDRWAQVGWETGWMGYPTSPEMCGLVDGGCWQTFQGGRMYWSYATDAFPVRGSIGEAWNATGYEHGFLGYPTSVEFCGLRNGGCFQRYEGGSFYWSPGTGAHWIRGAIRDEWGRRGWENGQLGYPTTGEICGLVNGGCFQRLQGGSLYWSMGTGAHPVIGAIRDYWGANNWEKGRFGYPTSGETCRTVDGVRTCTQRFARGTITWDANRGARG